MFEGVIIYAIIAGIGVAIVAAVMGCFVVWRRMAYFGDSLAHSALLGVALGLASGISTNISIVIICIIFALLLLWLGKKKIFANDTLLGILAHSSLSIGMVTISILGQDIDLHEYLFGDILTITLIEIYWIYAGGVVVLLLLINNWSNLVLITINEDLAKASGVKILLNNMLFMLLMTIVVALSIHIVGILLITSLLIIPAATAKQLSYSPESMAVLAAIFGIIATISGIIASVGFSTPSGPSIVVALSIMFILVSIIRSFVKKPSY